MFAQCMSVPIQRRYYSSPLSIPHLLSLTLTLLGVILPLFLAAGSSHFWSKTNTYAEQPKVKLTYDVITVLEGERTLVSGQKQYLRILPSSMPTRIQQLLQESMRASQIKSYEADYDRDGLPDALHVDISVPLQDGEAIYQARSFVFLDFTVQNHAKFNMDALAVFSYTSPIAGRSLGADGDLVLNMRQPVHVTRSMETPFASSPLLNITQIQSLGDIDLNAIINQYRSRSCYTHFDVPYPMWTNDISPTALRADHTRTFDLHLTIRVPSMDVLYRPTWSELLKTAWIQYYCIFVIIHAITWGISHYLFTKRVVDTFSVLDDHQIVTKKKGV